MEPQSKASSELYSISILRGLAALGVVVFHVRVDLWVGWNALRSGTIEASAFDHAVSWLSAPAPFLGSCVMLFFVISGFCIALPYAGDQGRPAEWREYWIRRLVRIYPPYIVTLLLCVGVERATASSGIASPPGAYGATALMIQNYTTGQVYPNPSFWSLPVEVELYLLFPLVLMLLRRWGQVAVWSFTAVVSLLAMAAALYGVDWAVSNAARFWIIWSAGAVLAEWFRSSNFCGPSLLWLIVALSILSCTLVAYLRDVPHAVTDFGFGFFYFVLVWWALGRESVWRSLPGRLSNPLLTLGTLSYSLYLIHFPFFRLSGYLWQNWFDGKPVNLLISFAFVLASLVPAWLLYQLIEAPSHELAKRWARSLKCR